MALRSGIPHTLSVAVSGDDGPLTLDSAPTVTIYGPDGASVASGKAVGTPAAWTFALAPLTRLGVYTGTIAGAVGGVAVTDGLRFEIVGGYLFSLDELRTFDANLADTTRYTGDFLKSIRDYVSDEFYMVTYRALVKRGAIETCALSDNGVFYVDNIDPLTIVAASVDGVPLTDLSSVSLSDVGTGFYGGPVATPDPYGVFDGSYSAPTMGSNITIEYTYGLPIVPADVKRAAMLRARTVAYDRDSGIPDRATSFQSAEGGNFQLATAGRAGFETGIPEVDAILARYRLKPPGVA